MGINKNACDDGGVGDHPIQNTVTQDNKLQTCTFSPSSIPTILANKDSSNMPPLDHQMGHHFHGGDGGLEGGNPCSSFPVYQKTK